MENNLIKDGISLQMNYWDENSDFKEKLFRFISIIRSEIELPNMNQSRPVYYFTPENEKPYNSECCFGARVGMAMIQEGLLERSQFDRGVHFKTGIDCSLRYLNLKILQLELLFWACGAGLERFAFYDDIYDDDHGVFSSHQWVITPAKFLDNLSRIETEPSMDFCKQIAYFNDHPPYPRRNSVYKQLLNQ